MSLTGLRITTMPAFSQDSTASALSSLVCAWSTARSGIDFVIKKKFPAIRLLLQPYNKKLFNNFNADIEKRF